MFDLDVSKIALIGAVALIVIGPEKLPKVARTVGTLVGKAQRYVSDVKAEVNRAMEMEDLKKMRESFESAAKEVQTSVNMTSREVEQEWSALSNSISSSADSAHLGASPLSEINIPSPLYRNPNSGESNSPRCRSGSRRSAGSGVRLNRAQRGWPGLGPNLERVTPSNVRYST